MNLLPAATCLYIKRLSLLLRTCFFVGAVQAQCPPGDLGKGQFLPTPSGCATYGLDITYQPIYDNLDDNAQIVIDWGDGTPNTVIDIGSTGNQSGIFYDTPHPHTYTEENTSAECVYTITSYVISGCYTLEETTVQEDIVVWNTDNYGNGGSDLAPTPILYEVCAGTTALVNFEDLSPWNCTDLMVTMSVNDQPRWTQWVYGSFSDISGTVTVDGNDEAPYPHQGPVHEHLGARVLNPVAPGNESLEVSVPATAQVGEEFHVRLNNWNQCNPYEDLSGNLTGNSPVFRDAIIRIVDAPSPDFQTRLGTPSGPIQTTFCLQQDIYFENLTSGGNRYTWEFFDDGLGNDRLATSTQANPTYAWDTPGTKMIRLNASKSNVAGCSLVMEGTVEISQDAIAQIEFYDAAFQSMITPSFCQDGLSTFDVGLRDATTNIEPATVWRWEFRDESNTLLSSLPPGANAFSPTRQSDTVLTFSDPGYTVVRLIARNSLTLCETVAEDTIFVYGSPKPSFVAPPVCEGEPTQFSAITAGSGPWINGDSITTYEWDFVFDGTFSPDTLLTHNESFGRYLDGQEGPVPTSSVAGNYSVALRVTTALGNCASIFVDTMEVLPLPTATLSISTNSICPGEAITIENTSDNSSFAGEYQVEIRHDSSQFRRTFPLIAADTTLTLDNPDDFIRTYQIVLSARSSNGCENASSARWLEVLPDADSRFTDPNYSYISANCSPWQSTLEVDDATQNLDPDSYTWLIRNPQGQLMDGYPLTKNRGDTAFHQLHYEIVHDGSTIATYQIVLQTIKMGLCVANDTFDVQISPQPSAAFAIQRHDECDRVHFEIEAAQKGLQYLWQFDPQPDLLQGEEDVRYATYNRPEIAEGILPVIISLQSRNLADCSSEPTTEEVIVENKSLDITALFILSADTLKLPQGEVGFTNLSSMDATYLWSFGDGDTSTLYSPGSHVYTEPGQYRVVLTVSTAVCDQEFSRILTVLPPEPIIDFEATPVEGCSPLTVQFRNTSSGVENGQYIWDFGDGSISEADEPTHTYFEGGAYTVRLRGENAQGVVENEKTEYIQVFQSPRADFLATPRVVYVPDQQLFFRNLSRDASTYLWDFGDGTTSDELEPRHTYKTEGIYDIQLVASNARGCVDTLFRSGEVEAVTGGLARVPNAFTPSLAGPTGGEVGILGNSDPSRINDIFLPKVEGVSRFRMMVYNKWGQLLFESTSQYRGWDGYYRGHLAPAGVYVYRLDLTYSDGREEIKAGDLTLIR